MRRRIFPVFLFCCFLGTSAFADGSPISHWFSERQRDVQDYFAKPTRTLNGAIFVQIHGDNWQASLADAVVQEIGGWEYRVIDGGYGLTFVARAPGQEKKVINVELDQEIYRDSLVLDVLRRTIADELLPVVENQEDFAAFRNHMTRLLAVRSRYRQAGREDYTLDAIRALEINVHDLARYASPDNYRSWTSMFLEERKDPRGYRSYEVATYEMLYNRDFYPTIKEVNPGFVCSLMITDMLKRALATAEQGRYEAAWKPLDYIEHELGYNDGTRPSIEFDGFYRPVRRIIEAKESLRANPKLFVATLSSVLDALNKG